MRRCLLDSGPMVALFNKSDRYHQNALKFLKSFEGKLITTLASITEVVYLLDFSRKAQLAFLEWIGSGAIHIEEIQPSDIRKFMSTFEKYSDLQVDFADACLVMLAEKLDIDEIATIDKDFFVYRIHGFKSFKIHVG